MGREAWSTPPTGREREGPSGAGFEERVIGFVGGGASGSGLRLTSGNVNSSSSLLHS